MSESNYSIKAHVFLDDIEIPMADLSGLVIKSVTIDRIINSIADRMVCEHNGDPDNQEAS